jgi:hypothetical protein
MGACALGDGVNVGNGCDVIRKNPNIRIETTMKRSAALMVLLLLAV